MKINVKNKEIVNSVKCNIHDYTFKELHMIYDSKRVIMNVATEGKSATVPIIFENVIGIEMTSCDFLAASPYIFRWRTLGEKEEIILPKLFRKREMLKQSNNFDASRLTNKDDYIEVEIFFNSGDFLNIACEYILFNK